MKLRSLVRKGNSGSSQSVAKRQHKRLWYHGRDNDMRGHSRLEEEVIGK